MNITGGSGGLAYRDSRSPTGVSYMKPAKPPALFVSSVGPRSHAAGSYYRDPLSCRDLLTHGDSDERQTTQQAHFEPPAPHKATPFMPAVQGLPAGIATEACDEPFVAQKQGTGRHNPTLLRRRPNPSRLGSQLPPLVGQPKEIDWTMTYTRGDGSEVLPRTSAPPPAALPDALLPPLRLPSPLGRARRRGATCRRARPRSDT